MKTLLSVLAVAAVARAAFVPSPVDEGFKPIAQKWRGSFEVSDDDDDEYDYHHGEFEDQPKTIHVHEDHGHYDHHHFEDYHEHHPPPIVSYHEHPKTVHIHERPEVHVVKEHPQTVHVHEHHHHHVKTLPVSIIKKTVLIKHG